jgi:tetratricopeptide (TPR) repeat protein
LQSWVPWVLFALAVLAYLPTLRNGFIWDDDTLITRNAWVTHPNALRGLVGIWTGEGSPDYFPLTSTTFWVEWHLWGNWAAGFHLVNVLLHAAATVLFWKVLTRLGLPASGALAAAALFAVHPVNVESVAWIAERKNTLSLVFFLWSILRWLEFRAAGDTAVARRHYRAALVCFVAALLAKTSTVMLPFVLLLLAWWQESGRSVEPSPVDKKKRKPLLRAAPGALSARAQQVFVQTLPFFGAALLFGLLTVYFQSAQGINLDTRNRPSELRVAQAGVNLWFYLYKTILPVDLATVYPEARLAGATPLSFLPLAAWLGLLAGLWHCRRVAAARHAFLALAFFTLNLAPVLGIVNMAWTALSPVGDHFLYIPMLGILALVAGGLQALAVRQGIPKPALAVAAGVAVAAMTVSCWMHAAVYRNMVTLWTFNTKARPQSGFAFYQLGLGYKLEGNPDVAAEQFRKAIERSPRILSAHFELGLYHFSEKRYGEAMAAFRAVLNLAPHSEAFLYLVESMWRSGEVEGATALYLSNLASHPRDPVLHNAYGRMLEETGKPEEALVRYRIAATAAPENPVSYFNAGNLLLSMNRTQEAAEAYQVALERNPTYPEAWFNLGLALRTLGKNTEAETALRTALSLKPELGTPAATQATGASTQAATQHTP